VSELRARSSFADDVDRPLVRDGNPEDRSRATLSRPGLSSETGAHPEADSRFDAWMRRSLTLEDRNMLVAALAGELRGEPTEA
jgi:hypothetical protein